ncbi:MAG: hypothetical protein JRJ09_08890 [Deltaproteobacteria bacterium]|nr:hypothetical protein [Deltaproteobacteria bacterium]MBW2048627.1 hypothetical protein [Deltaproteobacteria bacterium]MBW2112779.1 hypothetical protein [Deltaproteobacteria bacterium]MBW2353737.1 hypothetical protein [Deltaproteobacteria bacterium]
MKRHTCFSLLILTLLLSACAATGPSKKGALVNVYRPNPVKEAMVCTTEGEQGISYMYVGPETVSGKVAGEEKRIIAQYARAVLGQTRFINPISVPAMSGEYPDLSIRVHRLSVKTVKRGDRITRDGVFQASFSIRQAGMIECSTSDPILIEKHHEVPVYKKERLPSPIRLKETMVKEAVKRVVRQFVPVKSRVLRPVKSGGDLADKGAQMIDAGNCSGAYEVLRAAAGNQDCDDAALLYNTGVALECMAWSAANDQKTQVRYLKRAGEFYRRAAVIDPGDREMQRAMKDVTYELDTFFASFERQKATGRSLDQYKAPTSY